MIFDKTLIVATTATIVSASTFVITAFMARRSRVTASIGGQVRDRAALAAVYFGEDISAFVHPQVIKSNVIVNPPFASIVSHNVDPSTMDLPSKRPNLDLAVPSNTMAVQNGTRLINVLQPTAPLAMA
jgi:hypothetical protein